MKQWKTRNGYIVFQLSSGRSNAFLVSKGGINVLVDTGNQYAYYRLRKSIDSLGLAQKKIVLLILTHTHFDHCRNAFAIKEYENCSILMSEEEAEFAKKGYTPLPEGTLRFSRLISGLGKQLGQKYFGYHSFSPDILIKDEFEWTENDYNIQIISTAGHSIGSVSVIIDNEIALVGDTMLGFFTDSIFPPFAEDIKTMIQSWAKLLRTECTLFIPGHGSAIKRKLLEKEYHKFALKYNI